MPGATERLARAGEAYSMRLDALDQQVDRLLGEEKISLKGPWPRRLLATMDGEAVARLLLRAAGAAAGRPPGRKQIEKVLLRLRRDPVFHESFAGHRLTATPRFVRLKKAP
jgi:hypothetical protein